MGGRHGTWRWSLAASALVGCLLGCGLVQPKPKKPLGAGCTDDMACDSLMCSTSGNLCSHDCTYDRDCSDVSAAAVCRRRDDGGNWCSKPMGAPPGRSCTVASDCDHNECLKHVGREDEPGVCSKSCQSAGDCGAGVQTCAALTGSGSVKACIPPESFFGDNIAVGAFVRSRRTGK